MQRTINPLPKHPTYANRPVPTMQLLSKLSKFQGERKDIINKNPQDLANATPTIGTPLNATNEQTSSTPNDLLLQYQQRSESRQQQQQVQKEYAAYLDPNFKPEDPKAALEKTSHRYKYNAHMNSSVGKLFKNPDDDAGDDNNNPDDDVDEITNQTKRPAPIQKISNFNNAVIGGQPTEGDHWQTTHQLMNNGEDPLNKKKNNRKKIVQKFEPELFVSPITGEPIADYGTWKDDIQDQGKPKSNQDDDPDAAQVDDPLLQKLKTQLSLRGAKGIIGLSRLFRIMDDDDSKSLSFQEFKKAMKEFGMSLSDTEMIVLFKKFDTQNTGAITYTSFLTTIAGALNKRRAKFVNMAFDIMDEDKNGYIELSDIAGRYNASKHPDVLSGQKTQDQVLLEFLDTFTAEGHSNDHRISREEFQHYYSALSASIDRDDYFELMMRNAWHISGGEGVAENSANRRVLVTKSDGSQEVVEIQHDLGLNMKDTKEVIKRLKEQGCDAVKISVFDSNDSTEKPSNPKGKPNLSKSAKSPSKKFGKPSAGDRSDPNTPNPAVAPSAGTKLLIDKVKKALKLRGVNCFFDLQRRFKIMDDDNSGSINFQEFKKAIKEIQSLQDLTDNDLRSLFSYFDTDHSGTIDFNEFVAGIRDPMNDQRLFLVKKAFSRLDTHGHGYIDIEDVINVYDTSKHPEVISKRKTKNQVLTEFLANFEVGGTVDGKVTMEEFINYYNNISASIDNDNYFELMICNAWHITATEDKDGKKNSTYNTANLRVNVTNSQGIDEVITLENDLGINSSNKNDIKLLYSRLKQQGVTDIYAINGKIIKVLNVNGVEIITTAGETAQLTKDDGNTRYNPKANAPAVLKAPPVRRPQSAGVITSNANQNRPIAGLPDTPPPSTTAPRVISLINNSNNNNNAAPKRPTTNTIPQKSNSANIQTNYQNFSNNILQNLTKRKEINNKITEENIAGNTLLGVLRVQLLSKGVGGIVELQRRFQGFDTNQDGSIELDEFKLIFQTLQITFSEDQIETLFNFLDQDGSGGIDYYEFLDGLRGPINPKLLVLIHQVFDRLDRGNQNAITPDVLIQNYNASRHPDVMTGNASTEQVLQEFLNTFDVGTVQAGIITRDEFVRYYHNLNMVVNDDDYLELIIRRVWNFNDGDDLPAAPRSGNNNKTAGRIQNAKNFGNEYWGGGGGGGVGGVMGNAINARPSTSSGIRNSNSGTSTPRNSYVQGTNQFGFSPGGDQSAPPSFSRTMPARPKSASQLQSGRNYELMGNSSNNINNNSGNYGNQPVTPEMIEEKANNIRRDAILEFNAGNFKDSLEYFKLVLQLLQSIYPSNHPECVKAEKSILLTQRKIKQVK